MILSDTDILARRSMVFPFVDENVQPASIDLTLDPGFLVPRQRDFVSFQEPIDLGNPQDTYKREPLVGHDGSKNGNYGYQLWPGKFVLGATSEVVNIPNDIAARVEGKSSLARFGLLIHAAGFIDPGYSGKITLEFYNMNSRPIHLRPGIKICQLSFLRLTQSAARPYGSEGLGSRYQNSDQVIGSRYTG